MELDNMKLPKINKIKHKSKLMQSSLKLDIQKLIEKFEIDNEYDFELYEIDNVLLEIIQDHHRSYLTAKFGYDMV